MGVQDVVQALAGAGRALFNPAGFGMNQTPAVQGVAEAFAAPVQQGAQAFGGNPSAIGMYAEGQQPDFYASGQRPGYETGGADPSVMIPWATEAAGMATTGALAAPAVRGGIGMGIRAYHGSPARL